MPSSTNTSRPSDRHVGEEIGESVFEDQRANAFVVATATGVYTGSSETIYRAESRGEVSRKVW